MRHLYSFLLFCLLPFVFLRLWWRGKQQIGYRQRWGERLGFIKKTTLSKIFDNKPRLWLHTVSVGEFIAAKPLIDHFLKEDLYQLVITCTTPTGSEQIKKSYSENIIHVYAPYDLSIFIKRFIKVIKPKAYLIMETELWPNTIHHCKKNNIPSILVNARLSEKSARGYQKLSRLSKELVENLSLVVAQYENDAIRFKRLGLQKEKCIISGSIKFDLEINKETIEQAHNIRSWINSKNELPIFIAASTHKGEDQKILSAFKSLKQNVCYSRLILVPRHVDRFEEVYNLWEKNNLNVIKRSEHMELQTITNKEFDILLGDTMGEMLSLLGASDIAFIGGSLIENGGHNYIEAAVWQIPILAGPSRFNFQTISEQLIANDGLTIINDEIELAHQWQILIENPKLRKKKGDAAKFIADQNRGALSRAIIAIESAIGSSD